MKINFMGGNVPEEKEEYGEIDYKGKLAEVKSLLEKGDIDSAIGIIDICLSEKGDEYEEEPEEMVEESIEESKQGMRKPEMKKKVKISFGEMK